MHEGLVLTALAGVCFIAAAGRWQKTDTLTKLAQAKSDMRTMAVALEAYYAQNQDYPPQMVIVQNTVALLPPERTLNALTTPIAFLSQTFSEPFNGRQGWTLYQGWDVLGQASAPPDRATRKTLYWFSHFPSDPASQPLLVPLITIMLNSPFITFQDIQTALAVKWTLMSPGPDGYYGFDNNIGFGNAASAMMKQMITINIPSQQAEYDPSNGLVSSGDIARRYQSAFPTPPHFNSANTWERYR